MLKAMRRLGFNDAQVTVSGADSGIDLESRRAVAQVKYWPSQKVGRPDVQQLRGAAGHKRAIFFAFGERPYTTHAVEWASDGGVALFAFDLCGVPIPLTEYAFNLCGGELPAEEPVFAPPSAMSSPPDSKAEPIGFVKPVPSVKPLDGGARGWYIDPFGRHDMRWWDGEDWSGLVRDGDTRSSDEPEWA
jgi:hypothetical protein